MPRRGHGGTECLLPSALLVFAQPQPLILRLPLLLQEKLLSLAGVFQVVRVGGLSGRALGGEMLRESLGVRIQERCLV